VPAAVCAEAAQVQADVAAKTVREDVFPRPPVSFPDGVIALPDIEYANLIGYRPLLLDIYRPAAAISAGRPLVILCTAAAGAAAIRVRLGPLQIIRRCSHR